MQNIIAHTLNALVPLHQEMVLLLHFATLLCIILVHTLRLTAPSLSEATHVSKLPMHMTKVLALL